MNLPFLVRLVPGQKARPRPRRTSVVGADAFVGLAAGEKTRDPGKTQRAERTKVDSAAPTRKGSHDEPWRRHGVDAQ